MGANSSQSPPILLKFENDISLLKEYSMLLMSSSNKSFVELIVYKKGDTQFWSIYASETKVYSQHVHNYNLKIFTIQYFLNSLLILQTEVLEKRRISVPHQVPKKEEDISGDFDDPSQYKLVKIKKNYYLNILIGESLYNTQPKFLSDGEIKNVYIEANTGLLTIELFGIIPMTKEELKKITDSKNRDSLHFSRWTSYGSDFELTEYVAVDYTANSYDPKVNYYYYYSQIVEYDVVNLDFVTLFVFQIKLYRAYSYFHRTSPRAKDQTVYLVMDDQSKDIVYFKNMDP